MRSRLSAAEDARDGIVREIVRAARVSFREAEANFTGKISEAAWRRVSKRRWPVSIRDSRTRTTAPGASR